MKKLVLLLMVVVLPASAFMVKVKDSVRESLEQIADYEGLEGAAREDFEQAFLERLLPNKEGFHVTVDDLRVIKPFIKKSGNPVFQNWLFQAIDSGDHDSVQYLISELGIDVNAVDAYGDSALHCAFVAQEKNTAAILLQMGADIEALGMLYDGERFTPLGYVAAKVGYNCSDWNGVIALLVENGANIDLVSDQGQDFFQALEVAYNEQIKSLSVRRIAQIKIQKALNDSRAAINRVLKIPLIAEKLAERQALELAPFLPGEHSVIDLVTDYASYKEIKKGESGCEENKSEDGE